MSRKPKRPQQRSVKTPEQPWWKRPTAVWLGSIGTAFVVAIVTALGTGFAQGVLHGWFGNQSSADSAEIVAKDGPVAIESVQYQTPGALAISMAFPQELSPSQASKLNTDNVNSAAFQGNISAFQDYAARLRALNGAWMKSVTIQTVLRGNSKETVTIAGLELVKHCTAPLTGTLLYSPSAGANPTVQLDYNLDEEFPTPTSATLPGNYFVGHVITLEQGENQAISLTAGTSTQSCRFTFQLLVDTSHGQIVEPITDHGKPFAVTAYAKVDSYKEIYGGGVLSPSGNDMFGLIKRSQYAKYFPSGFSF